MSKRITCQRRGRGSSTYRAPSHRYHGRIKYPEDRKHKENETTNGTVTGLSKDPARSAPVIEVRLDDGKNVRLVGTEGVKVGDVLSIGAQAPIARGNTLPLSKIMEGTPINNIENNPGDGGKLIRSSGTYGLVVSHDRLKTVIQLPSGTLKTLNSRCRATIGIVAGGGRRDKPIMRAGKMYWMLGSKAKYWPIVRKVKMNAVSHPHGGGSGHPGKPTCVSRNTPPGRKVGLIAARRSGGR
jgi:large subunit ribosomal protein L2